MKASDLEVIRALLRGAVEGENVPGVSLLLAHRGEVIFREAYGWADVEAQRPLTPDDLVWIGSSTKPISATCVMRLADQGRIDLDVPIQQYLPEFRGTKLSGGISPSVLPSTRQLLSHTSGIIATTAWSVFWEPEGTFDPNRPPPRQAVFDRMSPVGTPLTISHGGALGTTLWIDLDRELVGVFFTQMQPPTPTVREVTRLIQGTVRQSIPASDD
jgi:CubicO group peptidase (beta-lactamase class C family)